jgi:trk system potassium uptake protein TrkH
MRLQTVQRVLGVLLTLFSFTMLPPIAVGVLLGDPTWEVFATSFVIILIAGLFLWLPVRTRRQEMRLRDGFLIVALFWIVLGLFGSVPLLLSAEPAMSFTDAAFESISGLTTTGATVLEGLDLLPPSILYYRQQLQWFGGLGIIVLAVAVLPMLGVGGMQLYRAEMPGPIKDNKLTPRITETAKALWYVYVAITVVCSFAYWLAGMSVFDAVCHGFGTVAIGGFSPYDASFAHFDSPTIETIAVFFMFVAGVNFSLHFLAWRGRSLLHYLADPEFKTYVGVLAVLTAFVVLYLAGTSYYPTWMEALRKGAFQAVSFATTTGYTTDAYSVWPSGLPVLLIFVSFIGGCGGSAAGGIKVMRCMLMYKQGMREFQRLIHPSAEVPVKIGGKPVQHRVVDAVWGFFAMYVVVFAVLMLVMVFSGLDQVSAFAAVASTINNLGPSLGVATSSFQNLSDVAKWASICAMLLGRLEIFALLVLVTPSFWRG